jgi:hypothetical protein
MNDAPSAPLQFFMHGPVHIIPGNIRDVSYVTANIRDVDRVELECQMPQWDASIAARMAMAASFPRAWTAWYKGEPRVAFGFSIVNVAVLQAWMWGDRYTTRCLPAIAAMKAFILADLKQQGWRRIEVRVMSDHRQAVTWIKMLGGKTPLPLMEHGRNGEAFTLYSLLLPNLSVHSTPA